MYVYGSVLKVMYAFPLAFYSSVVVTVFVSVIKGASICRLSSMIPTI